MPDNLENLFRRGDTLLDSELKLIKDELTQNYREALKAIRLEIMAMAEKYGDMVQLSELQQYNRLTNLERYIAEQLKDLGVNIRKLTSDSIKNFFSQSYYYTGYALESSASVKLGFGLLNPRVIEESLFNPLDRIKWTDRLKANIEEANNRVRTEITQGLIKGDGLVKTSARIQERLEISANKSMRIVRTETHRAQNYGSLRAFDKSNAAADRLGLKIKLTWISVRDARTRSFAKGDEADHVNMNGVKANNDGLFTLPTGIRTKGPGLSGVVAEDINCRCTIGAEFEGLDKIKTDKEIESYGSFEEWKKGRVSK